MTRWMLIATLSLAACKNAAVEPTPTEAPPAPTETVGHPDGAACMSGAECASGICEGSPCDVAGTCQPQMRACTRDLVVWCGCDGATFQQSGSCPGVRTAHRGACP